MRALLALVCLGMVAGVYQGRERIAATTVAAGEIAQGGFASIGFGIKEISITGLVMTREDDVVKALNIDSRTWIGGFDAHAARARIIALPAVADATVRKIYPDKLVVTVTENTPIARWRDANGHTFLIDAAGDSLGEALSVDDRLPLVIGAGAADDALVMVKALRRYPGLSSGLVALSRLADRRWDMIYKSGLRVRLPEKGVGQALKKLDDYQHRFQLLDRAVSRIDMRVPGMLVVRPIKDAKDGEAS